MEELTIEQQRNIRIMDLEETFESIKESQSDSEWFRELTSIENAINYLKSL